MEIATLTYFNLSSFTGYNAWCRDNHLDPKKPLSFRRYFLSFGVDAALFLHVGLLSGNNVTVPVAELAACNVIAVPYKDGHLATGSMASWGLFIKKSKSEYMRKAKGALTGANLTELLCL